MMKSELLTLQASTERQNDQLDFHEEGWPYGGSEILPCFRTGGDACRRRRDYGGVITGRSVVSSLRRLLDGLRKLAGRPFVGLFLGHRE